MPREAWRASGPGSLTAYRCLWLQAYWDAISLLVKRGWAAMMSQCLWVLRNWESLRILDKMLDRHLDLYEQFCQHSAVSLLIVSWAQRDMEDEKARDLSINSIHNFASTMHCIIKWNTWEKRAFFEKKEKKKI